MNFENLDKLIADKYINVQKHPTLDLYIHNYSHKCQFDSAWCEETESCRGLIMDGERRVIARPFKKFFNLSQVPNLPAEPFTVTEKLDGCFLRDTKILCYDGSFISIGDIVLHGKRPVLMGVEFGKIVPAKITNVFNNGTKDNWVDLTFDCAVSKKTGSGGHPNKMRVTSNHRILKGNNYVPAGSLVKGDLVTTYEYSISEETLRVIKAGLLGDGSLCSTGGNFNYIEGHKFLHCTYTDTVGNWLGKTTLKKIDFRVSGFGTNMQRVSTKAYPVLTKLRREWYPKGKKAVPKDLSWIDNFTVAKWYMDDGSLSHNNGQQDRALFHTNGFVKKDVIRLANKLSEMYGVTCVVSNYKGWQIRINATRQRTIDKFWKAISPYVINCMRYKLPQAYRNLSQRKSVKSGREIVVIRPAKLLSKKVVRLDKINNRKQFPSGRTGFDITTTTHNYFANGILVHNSLGIMYPGLDGLPAIATRGSFTSDQAMRATAILRGKYKDVLNKWVIPYYTYLFEIILPENRIVVDYGSMEDIVLLSVIATNSGIELPYESVKRIAEDKGISVVKQYDGISDIDTLSKNVRENAEGYVVRFESGLRVKIKFDEYVRLHRILTNVNAKAIWDMLRTGKGIGELIERVPDEFYQWVKNTERDLLAKYRQWETEAITIFKTFNGLSRKEFAGNATRVAHRGILFAMLDGKDYSQIIWKMLKPKAEKPFKVEE